MEKNQRTLIVLTVLLVFSIGIFLGLSVNRIGQPQQIDQKVVHATFVAVDEKGQGVAADLETEVKPGTGLVLVNINDVLADVSTQYSARIAAEVAAKYTKKDLSKVDIVYNLITRDAGLIAGQSAASIMAVSTIAALLEKNIRQDIIITGSIDEEGKIVAAGGIKPKSEAALSKNATLFLVPSGSASQVIGFTRKKACFDIDEINYCEIDYEGEKISLSKELGIEIREIRDIEEAVQFLLIDPPKPEEISEPAKSDGEDEDEDKPKIEKESEESEESEKPPELGEEQ